jgi:hypothetical protein
MTKKIIAAILIFGITIALMFLAFRALDNARQPWHGVVAGKVNP